MCIRDSYSINRDVQRSFRDLEQAIQPDEFSVAAPKPAKASKAKAEKEPEQKPSVKKQLQEIRQEQAEKKAEKSKQQERQQMCIRDRDG